EGDAGEVVALDEDAGAAKRLGQVRCFLQRRRRERDLDSRDAGDALADPGMAVKCRAHDITHMTVPFVASGTAVPEGAGIFEASILARDGSLRCHDVACWRA